ncbi:glycogen debranching protein GlgX [soil metagenome]
MSKRPPVSAPPEPVVSDLGKAGPIRAGDPHPQGATATPEGTNFSVFSEGAEKVELCLFDSPEAKVESARIVMPVRTHGVWHIFLEGVGAGQLYGYRCHGRYDPTAGFRFNPNKLLLDPYAKAIGREVVWDDALYGYTIGHEDADLSFDARDSAPFAPLGVVTDDAYDWEGDQRLGRRWHETVIYETHVKGMTIRHPDVPEELRGTYAGMASEPIIKYLTRLGITAVELLPIHHFTQDRHLLERGLSNYWGYNTLSFFAAEPRYSAGRCGGEVVREFRDMVKAFHRAGIEVILDVVYNHTAEGNELGPTLCLRGIDNTSYYRLMEDARYYRDFTGCGNTLNMVHPHSIQFLMDSLRYWASEMHVDGFRFDLASALARELHEVNKLGAFFDTIYQDPVLADVKLIAEPWDIGVGGYQVGNFPVGWTEWNGKYRDSVRKFWKGGMGLVPEIATRITGSADLYESSRRLPSASINFVTAHDGFTLADLVSYDHKHNGANGEDNADGSDDNESWNCGAEGPTVDAEVLELRERQKRNIFATLLFSQGVPMILGGDEIARTQGGNNNTYCQDSEISWFDWDLDDRRKALLEFVRSLVALRAAHPNLHRRSFNEQIQEPAPGRAPVSPGFVWLRPDGEPMDDEDWDTGWTQSLALRLDGLAPEIFDEELKRVSDSDFILLLNASDHDIAFDLPARDDPWEWVVACNTAGRGDARTFTSGESLTLECRSVILLEHARDDD